VLTERGTGPGVGEGEGVVFDVDVDFGFEVGVGVRVVSKVERGVGDGAEGPGVGVDAEGVGVALVESIERRVVRSAGVGLCEPDWVVAVGAAVDRAATPGEATNGAPAALELSLLTLCGDKNAPRDVSGDRCFVV
jgi:hypothetical protein